jgi:hypothetical protein
MTEGIWSPMDKAEIEALIAEQLAECDEDQKAVFEKYLDGAIKEHRCEQDDLNYALHHWAG